MTARGRFVSSFFYGAGVGYWLSVVRWPVFVLVAVALCAGAAWGIFMYSATPPADRPFR